MAGDRYPDAGIAADDLTWVDLTRLTHEALNRSYRWRVFDIHTAFDMAWSAMALAACEADHPLTARQLVNAARDALDEEIRLFYRTYGIQRTSEAKTIGGVPRFVQYWTVRPATPTDGIDERLALWQVFEALDQADRDVLAAYAMTDSYASVANLLGMMPEDAQRRVWEARQRAQSLWFDSETPQPAEFPKRIRPPGSGRKKQDVCKRGHAMVEENLYLEPRTGRRKCQACRNLRAKQRSERKKAAAS